MKRISNIFNENNESYVTEHITVGCLFSVIESPWQGHDLKAEVTVAAESIAKNLMLH
jgi:hypothetical protein